MLRIDLKISYTCNNLCHFCAQGDKREWVTSLTYEECCQAILSSFPTYKGIVFNDKKEIICIEFPLPPVPKIAEKPKTADEIEGYIKDEDVKRECNKVREYIKDIDINNIEEAPTKYSITYKYKGKNLCTIDPRTGYFWMGWRHIDGTWKTEGDIKTFDEAKEIIDEDIKIFYNHLKQKR